MVKHIIVTKEQQDKMADNYNKKMEKEETIEEIIKIQSSKPLQFVKVAKKEDLQKLSIGELYHILFISKQV